MFPHKLWVERNHSLYTSQNILISLICWITKGKKKTGNLLRQVEMFDVLVINISIWNSNNLPSSPSKAWKNGVDSSKAGQLNGKQGMQNCHNLYQK